MNAPLYAVTSRYQAALDELLDDDELPLEAITDTLEALEGEWEDKAKSVAGAILNLRASAQARRAAAARILETARTEETRAERLTDYLAKAMQALNRTRLDTPEWTARFKRCPPRVVVDDEAAVPEEFITREVTLKIDKRALREALKEANYLFAHLEQDTKLMIT